MKSKVLIYDTFFREEVVAHTVRSNFDTIFNRIISGLEDNDYIEIRENKLLFSQLNGCNKWVYYYGKGVDYEK